MPRIVILGTGTAVGKTYFTAALARALRSGHGAPEVLAVKPIETGLRPRKQGSDAVLLERASSVRPARPHPVFGFPDPISPHLAARRAKTPITIPGVLNWIHKSEGIAIRDATICWTLIETAGGAFSPLGPRLTNLDLAGALEPSIWVLVAPDSLGVLHEVTTTLLALRARARPPDFLVLAASRPPDASTTTNAAELRRLGIAAPIATLVRGRDPTDSLRQLLTALRTRTLKIRRAVRARA